MGEFMLSHEGEIYTGAFFVAITLVAVWEGVAPKRQTGMHLRQRWGGNIALAVINMALIHLILPVAAVGLAIVAKAHGIGILHWIDGPVWIAALVGFLALDLGRYLHHYLLHRLPLLWRVHRIHHADLDYDFTVGLRFHPIEGLFTTVFGFAVIALVGAPPIAVLASEALVAISGTFVHANGRTPRWVERHIRRLFVTPDMHRIHHSVRLAEHNSNYAAVLSIWDRLFGTYVADPRDAHETMEIGLPELRDPACLNLFWMLVTPLRRKAASPAPRASEAGTETAS